MAQLGLGLEGVLVVAPDATRKGSPKRAGGPASGQLSLLDLPRRASALTPAVAPVTPLIAPAPPIPPAPDPELAAPPPRRSRAAAPARSLIAGHVRLEEALRKRIGPSVLLRLTENTSTMISFKRRGRALYVRAHEMFIDAPDDVLDALAMFVTKDAIPKREASLLDGWIDRHRDLLTEARSELLRIQPFGETHDLQAMFDRLNAAHFGGKIEARITWTRAARGQRRSSIHMGTYSDDLKLIRIHPALDQAFVPDFFVEYVVFHEMLHQVHGVKGHGEGRRAVHPPAFKADEKRFPRYAEARRWERDNLRRLLRY